MMAFWKRAYPHDKLDSFWKRGLPVGTGVQAFWKRFVKKADVNEDIPPMFAHVNGPYYSEIQAADKKNMQRLQQQRRAKETSARRPEFNPTGW